MTQPFPALRIFVAWLALMCASCAFPPVKQTETQSQLELKNGIKSYEEGNYAGASKQLQSSINMGLESKNDQGSAHKYLAFIHCASGREKACREEFYKAFESDPKFDLQPAEAGHPMWGPIFRSIKGEVTAKAKSKSSAIIYSDYSML